MTLLCGRYEGFDARILEHVATESLSLGPFVLSGGEPAAMVVCDALCRLQPGALGDERSSEEESFSPGARAARSSTRTTRGRRSSAAGASPRSCCRATTGASRSGGASRRGAAAVATARTMPEAPLRRRRLAMTRARAGRSPSRPAPVAD